jgi:hypothetical protein
MEEAQRKLEEMKLVFQQLLEQKHGIVKKANPQKMSIQAIH